METYNYSFRRQRTFRHIFLLALTTFNRKRELERLIAWATYKNLQRVRIAYINRRDDDERRLFRLRQISPHAVQLAYIVHCIAGTLFPPTRQHRRGAGAVYRVGKVDRKAHLN